MAIHPTRLCSLALLVIAGVLSIVALTSNHWYSYQTEQGDMTGGLWNVCSQDSVEEVRQCQSLSATDVDEERESIFSFFL